MIQTSTLSRFVKSTSSIGCVGGEDNAPVDFYKAMYTSGIDCFGAENGSVESSTVELRVPVVPLHLYPKSSSIQVIAVRV